MLMIINALNGAWSDFSILYMIIQEESQKLIKNLLKKLDFKNTKFPVKIRGIHKIEKKELY